MWDKLLQFDGGLLIGIQQVFNCEALTPVMKAFTQLGRKGMLPIAICVILVLFKRTRKLGLICAASLAMSFILCNMTLKPLVDRPRPWITFPEVRHFMPHPGDASFPSGHAANTMAVGWAFLEATRAKGASALEGTVQQRAHIFGIAAAVVAAIIAFSRLYLGMHYPSDVLAGVLLGIITGKVSCRIAAGTGGRMAGDDIKELASAGSIKGGKL